ncbi:LL-diaminopimelate aminotransferase, partial [bacterium]
MKLMNEKLREFISYPFAELDSLKKKLKSAGRTIIDMGVGDPDFPPPKEIQGALVASLANPKTHNYPSYIGERELRQSFARFFLQRYKVKLDPEKNILVLIGTKEGIFHLPNA